MHIGGVFMCQKSGLASLGNRNLRGSCKEYAHAFNSMMPCRRRIVVLNSKTEAYIASCITNTDGSFNIKGLPVMANGVIEVQAHDDVTGKAPKIFDGLSLVE